MDVSHEHFLVEFVRSRKHGPVRSEQGARAVEDQVVVSTDLVHEDERDAGAARGGGQDLRAQRALVRGERRRRDVDEEVDPSGG